ncbi:MAG TPA: GNA1162 family protein [Candidatus Polarisedimenticolaceae bacterium]|nr:GNA1162 family protein [Candidatus Polarisedimenticolaceae bacterium]
MRTSWTARATAVLIVFGVSACSSHRKAEVTFHDPKMDFSLVQKVGVLPFTNLAQTPAAGERVRDVFSTMLQAGGSIYVLPPGEVARGIDRAGLTKPQTPTAEDCTNLGKLLQVDAVITGVVREYGEVRSGTASANVVSISVEMMETQTGRVVWSAASTRGGVSAADRLFGGGGEPMDEITTEAVRDLLDKLFK